MCWCGIPHGDEPSSQSRRRFACTALGAAAAASVGLIGWPHAAHADTLVGQPIVRTLLEKRAVPGSDQEMQMMLVTFPPGAASSPHHHPVPGLNYIVEGTAESAYVDDLPKLYRKGQTLQDYPGVQHTLFRNVSTTETLKFLIFANLLPGQPYLVVP